jgi:hypothetical protein
MIPKNSISLIAEVGDDFYRPLGETIRISAKILNLPRRLDGGKRVDARSCCRKIQQPNW